ncbi:tRNA/rRNA methyltransferase yfiF [Mizugakiibacter sediminis]|uniref:tRNA/rRNA methyltransferase yfiF n=1 Tax=Mizugakiibacter sediminis TaxID=1475481 RepID=A0A0K8QJ74_9GAMM|nr:TrmH family RNA methyltransferase [Mizugakiibacter sediminis]GAP64903.1 tRNA/rRNA methyltransferase yfiF [Mizugakiibacter sediminis]
MNRRPPRAPSRRPQAPRGHAAPREEEQRLFGLNACRAAFAHRPQDLRKVWLAETRIATLKPVLAWCVKHRLGYRVVDDAELARITGTQHHEGVCFAMRGAAAPRLAGLLRALPAGPALLAYLDGVGNPHNLGALLRSGAHFGLAAVIVPATSTLTLSGAAVRVAEGGAEAVPLVHAEPGEDAVAALRGAGFALAATVPRAGVSLFDAELPPRIALVFGAEETGIGEALLAAADLRLTIPGTGAVESLNIAASAAVCFAEWRRRHPLRA